MLAYFGGLTHEGAVRLGYRKELEAIEDPAERERAFAEMVDRMYEHVKDSYEHRGVKEDEAEERAARTVNEYKSEHGMTKKDKKR